MNYNTVAFEMAFGTIKQIPESSMPEICFSGRSNVGKSSLINKVLMRKSLARVSAKPGKTITINFYRLENLRLCDLPGYGYAKIAKGEQRRFAELMEYYFQSSRDIRLVIQLVDMRHPPSGDDIIMLRFLFEAGIPFVIALTKSDKLNKSERTERMESLKKELNFLPQNISVIPFSSITGEGVDEIRSQIETVSNHAYDEVKTINDNEVK